MPRRILVFDPADRFVAGTVGRPGNRTFFLQARKGGGVFSVALEKVQVAALAERLAVLLAELERRGITVPEQGSRHDTEPLDEPTQELFRVGTLALSYDTGRDRVTIEAREASGEDEEPLESDDDDDDGPDLLRVRLTLADTRDFVERAVGLVGSGRPPCPLCGMPLNPEGHICPRKNGYLN